MNGLIEQNQHAVDQGLEILDTLEQSGTGFTRVGPHFRHCIDFYTCFFRGVASGAIDYDQRARSGDIERQPTAAISALEGIRRRLGAMVDDESSTPVRARADAVGDTTEWTQSTVGRELLFLLAHTVHHFALIDLLLRQDGIELPVEFGVAPSTLEHERQHPCAR